MEEQDVQEEGRRSPSVASRQYSPLQNKATGVEEERRRRPSAQENKTHHQMCAGDEALEQIRHRSRRRGTRLQAQKKKEEDGPMHRRTELTTK
ncbi:hypothetical protein AXF42_Ash012152 [Apostasia shenzhenica]|uniref:Uncharacterized protein n=1 Tax=Apostasia shenzhenica TaxID=1088818 RepID=A0A2I0B443_9ASPA|nr:hypothetical protein AXF42_Ash012152 [Apostasia shenzhenica]